MSMSQINWFRIIVVLGAAYLLNKITSIYLPVITAIILAFILNPIVNYFCKLRIWPIKRRTPRGLAVLMAFLCAALLLLIVGTFVFLPFINEFDKFVANLPAIIAKIQRISIVIHERINTADLPGNLSTLVEQVVSSAANFSVDLATKIVNAIFRFASKLIEIVVVPVLTYYFLRDWHILIENFLTIFPRDRQPKIRTIVEEMARVISGYIRGQFWISVAVGLMVFSGMYLLGVEYPLVLGLLATLTETIPIIGPIVGAAPAILLAYLGSPALAVKVLLFFLIVHQLENHIIVPNIMGHTIDLHPSVIIIVLLIGSQLLGIVGMILAVPVAALLKVLIRNLWYP